VAGSSIVARVSDPSTGPFAGRLTITIGPRHFGGTRDVMTAVAFVAGLAVTVWVAIAAGLPGVIGTVYVLTAAAAWAQGFRRAWRVSSDRIEARRWFRWRTVERADVSAIAAARDEMGVRAVTLTGPGGAFEIDIDDVRVEPTLADALDRFVAGCDHATIDPAVARAIRP